MKFSKSFFVIFFTTIVSCLLISGCGIGGTNIITKTEDWVDFISNDIKFSFFDTKNYFFYINLTKSMLSGGDKYGINLFIRSDEKYLSKKNKIKIMVDTEVFEITPVDNGKIVSYNLY